MLPCAPGTTRPRTARPWCFAFPRDLPTCTSCSGALVRAPSRSSTPKPIAALLVGDARCSGVCQRVSPVQSRSFRGSPSGFIKSRDCKLPARNPPAHQQIPIRVGRAFLPSRRVRRKGRRSFPAESCRHFPKRGVRAERQRPLARRDGAARTGSRRCRFSASRRGDPRGVARECRTRAIARCVTGQPPQKHRGDREHEDLFRDLSIQPA